MDATLNRALSLRVFCAQFSYANIHPTKIFGVSGTLSALSPAEKKTMLAAFDVSHYSYIPSVYGTSNFLFDKGGRGIAIENDLPSYYQKLAEEITHTTRTKRAVIVFFQTLERLKGFENSPYGRKIKKKLTLKADMPKEERNYVIKKATTSSQVTLAVAVFGRGTDFFSKDRYSQRLLKMSQKTRFYCCFVSVLTFAVRVGKLDDAGGAHVIQTFLSLEKSEEVQIMGRTARQGKEGSYGMVLLESDLQNDFDVKPMSLDCVARERLYAALDLARTNRNTAHLASLEAKLDDANKRDGISRDYFQALLEGDATCAVGHLHRIYEELSAIASTAVDVHFLVDISGSMGGLLASGVSQLDAAKEGIKYIIQEVLDAQRGDTLSLTAFGDVYTDVLVAQPAWDKELLLSHVNSLQIRGGTMLYTAFISKLQTVLASMEHTPTQQFLFVFTDGAVSTRINIF